MILLRSCPLFVALAVAAGTSAARPQRAAHGKGRPAGTSSAPGAAPSAARATSPAATTTAAPTATTAAAPEASCGRGRRSALSELACELASGLGDVSEGTLVVAAPLAPPSDATAVDPSRMAALAARLTSVVAGALHGARANPAPESLSRARALSRAASGLVYLVPTLEQGELRVVADHYPTARGFWERARDPEPAPGAHAFGSRRLDAELRTFLPAVPLVAGEVRKLASPEREVLAVACGDLDADGASELIVVGRRHLHVGRPRNGALQVSATADWAELSPVAQSPWREPIGGAALHEGRFVDVGTSDRGEAVRLGPGLAPMAKMGRRVPWPDGGCSRFAGIALRGDVEPCVTGDTPGDVARIDVAADAIASATLVRSDGTARHVRAQRVASETTLELRDDQRRQRSIERVGAQLLVADLDGDGQPEIVYSLPTLNAAEDAIVVSTWLDDGSIAERYRLPVPDGVRAIAACPAEGSGRAPLIVATGAALWVVE